MYNKGGLRRLIEGWIYYLPNSFLAFSKVSFSESVKEPNPFSFILSNIRSVSSLMEGLSPKLTRNFFVFLRYLMIMS